MPATQVLIVDDNKGYREAFRRNLVLHGYDVREAEDSLAALKIVHGGEAEVVVTDLAMSHPTEGLDLIRQVKSLRPHLPIIMISAVGTFDEGAEATRLGACHVISKSKIDEEMANLYEAIDRASLEFATSRSYLDQLAELRKKTAEDRPGVVRSLTEMLNRSDIAPAIKGQIYEQLAELNRESDAETASEQPAGADLLSAATQSILTQVESALVEAIPGFEGLQEDTRQSVITAEFLYQQDSAPEAGVDFSRSMGFSYCFAVENESKARLRKRLQKFFAAPETQKLVISLLEQNRRRLSVFYQQYLLRLQKGHPHEATIDNIFHTFDRILEHRGRYKPDGLKALGIVLMCFGQSYRFRKFDQELVVDNPLGLRGFDGSDEVLEFASLLINLQHYRNPYIHPEISEMTKLSKIRETTFTSLKTIARIP